MNKLLLALSIAFVLSACSSKPPKDAESLPDGIMLPVEGTGAIAGGSFMPEIEYQAMPNGMK